MKSKTLLYLLLAALPLFIAACEPADAVDPFKIVHKEKSDKKSDLKSDKKTDTKKDSSTSAKTNDKKSASSTRKCSLSCSLASHVSRRSGQVLGLLVLPSSMRHRTYTRSLSTM